MLGLSKKDPLLRRRELLGPPGSPASLGSALAAACACAAGPQLRLAAAGDVVVEVARGGAGGLLAEVAGEGAVRAVHAAIVAEAGRGREGEGGPGAQGEGEAAGPQGEHVCTHYYASRALRRCAGGRAGARGCAVRACRVRAATARAAQVVLCARP